MQNLDVVFWVFVIPSILFLSGFLLGPSCFFYFETQWKRNSGFIKKYTFYLCRWQMSTPILAIALIYLSSYNYWVATVIANLIGGLIFFWVDRKIFDFKMFAPLWEIKENIVCADCGNICKGYRIVKTKNYDRINDPCPEFRCDFCSKRKLDELKTRGVKV